MNGERDKAAKIVQNEERRSAAGVRIPGAAMAEAYLGLGDKERAFAWLRRGVADGSVTLFEANTDPFYTAFLNDPRYREILASLRKPK
jgi:regulator of protease activity HflC (stomatin/prohibitin superfamily)